MPTPHLPTTPEAAHSPRFTPFPHLPLELRLQILDLALHTPRTIHITCHKSPFHARTLGIPRTVERFSSQPLAAPRIRVGLWMGRLGTLVKSFGWGGDIK